MTKSIQEKLQQVLDLSTNTIKNYTDKFEKLLAHTNKLTDEEKNHPFQTNKEVNYRGVGVEFTIDGVTDWNYFKLLIPLKTRNPKRERLEQPLTRMTADISNLLNGISWELSEYYKDKGLPQKIVIEIDILTKIATIQTFDKDEQILENHQFNLDKNP